jgi:predicted SAM-dependent methyltransferase
MTSTGVPTLKTRAKRILDALELVDFAMLLRNKLVMGKRNMRKTDSLLMEEFLRGNSVRKLHIGCGKHFIEGWLNSDFYPSSGNVMHLDATKTFPFADESFDYIYSEHMIEHIPYSDAVVMLRECFRVLKIGGTIRISTPDLRALIELHEPEPSGLHREYIDVHCGEFSPYTSGVFVINDFFRLWDHQFIYDDEILRSLLERSGFSEVREWDSGESSSDALKNLENDPRMPVGHLAFISFSMEGVKTS